VDRAGVVGVAKKQFGALAGRVCADESEHALIDSRIADLLPRGGVLVDLGCGSGAALDALSGFFELSVGLDIHTSRLETRAGPIQGWRFIKADLNGSFPLPSEHASAVLANQVIEHIANPDHFLAETRRILRPGGVFVLTTPNVRYIRHLFRLVVMGRGPSTANGGLMDGSWDNGHVHYFTHADLAELLVRHDFRHIRARALTDLTGGSLNRRLLDSVASVGIVREFMSGNALVVATK
jgi:SAM-dependent methyltransferase